MSEKAVWRRLRQVDQLHELCLSLMKAGRAHAEKTRAEENRDLKKDSALQSHEENK